MTAITTTWVLAAQDPANLARFYGALLGVEPITGLSSQHWRIPLPAGDELEIYRPSRHRPFPDRGRALAPCLRQSARPDPLEVLQEWVNEAVASGAVVVEPPRREVFGAECWLNDPEGNAVLLLVPLQGSSDTPS